MTFGSAWPRPDFGPILAFRHKLRRRSIPEMPCSVLNGRGWFFKP